VGNTSLKPSVKRDDIIDQ